MDKSSDAFRTISEVADDLALPQHVLRFWETRFPQIRPLKRAGGRRYYRPADVVLLRTIRQLLYDEGFTIKGVQKLLKEQGTRSLRSGTLPPPPALAEVDLDLGPGDDLEPLGPPLEPEHVPIAVEAAPMTAPVHVVDRDTLRDMLATLDECTRILEALRRPEA